MVLKMKRKSYYFIISLFISFILNGCVSEAHPKIVDLKDCTITFPSNYNISSYGTDNVFIKPTDLRNGIYSLYYDENLQDNNGSFRKFLSSYSNHITKKIEHLELVEATETHLKAQIYFLVGEHFYITFVKYNDDMKNVIRECNQSWK